MCWTKNLFVFLRVAVRRRRPPAAARLPPLLRHARKRACRARSARMPGGGRVPPSCKKMKRDCFFFACKYISDDTQFTKHKVDKEHKPQYCQQVP